jgi:hypothetical protein
LTLQTGESVNAGAAMIYILHFDTAYHHARHYVRYCADGTLDQRLARHRASQESRLMLAIEHAGIDFTVALTHPGDRKFERKLKRAKKSPSILSLVPPTSIKHTATCNERRQAYTLLPAGTSPCSKDEVHI